MAGLAMRNRILQTVGQFRRGNRLKRFLGVVAGVTGTCGAFLYFLDESVKAGEHIMPLPSYPWEFERALKSFDHAALRRGWQVYRTVCHTCHSLQYLRFGDLVNVSHTRDEIKAIAGEFEVDDGPDDQGNYFSRPAKLTDHLPGPYANEEAARAANFGSHPPDLTYVVQARKNGINYLFSLLTGWVDAPAGFTLSDNQYFNIYFPGGVTGMAQMLHEGIVDYDDGTPATPSQMAKDVVEFLSWTASQEHDTRKVMMIKATGICLILLACFLHIHRKNWSHMRSRQIAYVPKRGN